MDDYQKFLMSGGGNQGGGNNSPGCLAGFLAVGGFLLIIYLLSRLFQ